MQVNTLSKETIVDKIFECQYCEKTYNTKRDLYDHYRAKHQEFFKFKCEICGKQFDELRTLMSHVTKIHGNAEGYFNKYLTVFCSYDGCGLQLSFEQYKKQHGFCSSAHEVGNRKIKKGIKLNEKCELCGADFPSKKALSIHLANYHKLDKPKIKDYYDTYLKQDGDGFCKWCGKESSFRGLSESYADFCYNTACGVLWNNKNTDRMERVSATLSDTLSSGDVIPNQKGYWLKRGYTDEESSAKVTERQTTFTKEKCIEKLGDVDGLERWKERQRRWLSTLDDKSDDEKRRINKLKIQKHKICVSKSEKELRDVLACDSQLRIDRKDNNTYYIYDLYNERKIIEYNGDYWHCNPNKYKEDYFNTQLGMTAAQKWEEDDMKSALAISLGYDIKIVWESDYRKDKETVIQDCLEFLYG